MPNSSQPEKLSDSARKAGQSERAKKRAAEQGMPKSTGRPLQIVKAEEDYKHPDLLSGGLAKPGREISNISKYGYESVQAHFVRGPADLPMSAIARVWNIPISTLHKWIQRDGWEKLRADRLEQTPATLGGTLVNDVVKAAQQEFLDRETKIINAFLDDVETAQTEKTEQVMSPSGEMQTRNKGAITRRTEFQTAKLIFEHARMALGLRTKPGMFDGATINATSITMVTETRPAVQETQSYLDATLKELLPLESEAVEGEVV